MDRLEANGIVGMLFHTFETDEDGKRIVQHQGCIVSQVSADIYLVRYFDWIMGFEIPGCKLMKLDDMMECRFYNSDEEMREAYERYKRN